MFANILKFSYWFDVRPLFFTPIIFWILFGVFVLAVLVGVLASIIISKNKPDKLKKRIWVKISRWGYTAGLVGLLLIFLKQQRTPYLGMRIWTLLWLVASFIWLIFILKYILIKVPKIRREQKQKEEFEKYLP